MHDLLCGMSSTEAGQQLITRQGSRWLLGVLPVVPETGSFWPCSYMCYNLLVVSFERQHRSGVQSKWWLKNEAWSTSVHYLDCLLDMVWSCCKYDIGGLYNLVLLVPPMSGLAGRMSPIVSLASDFVAMRLVNIHTMQVLSACDPRALNKFLVGEPLSAVSGLYVGTSSVVSAAQQAGAATLIALCHSPPKPRRQPCAEAEFASRTIDRGGLCCQTLDQLVDGTGMAGWMALGSSCTPAIIYYKWTLNTSGLTLRVE
ncbi:hypothetical protein MIR68_008884 [Amoeboaphelidium protococcarum]|nr:hypothetical protein MIR68_008884 [Amoeboaphelidium protococcarum]